MIIAGLAAYIAYLAFRSQRTHNKNSVKPILNIIVGDYEDDIFVRIDNNGVGPAIVQGINCYDAEKNRVEHNLYTLIPEFATIKEPRITYQPSMKADEKPEPEMIVTTIEFDTLTDFVEDIAGRTIPPGGSIMLLRMTNPDKYHKVALRDFLSKCSVKVDYTDVYNSELAPCYRKLDFFGRGGLNGQKVEFFEGNEEQGPNPRDLPTNTRNL